MRKLESVRWPEKGGVGGNDDIDTGYLEVKIQKSGFRTWCISTTASDAPRLRRARSTDMTKQLAAPRTAQPELPSPDDARNSAAANTRWESCAALMTAARRAAACSADARGGEGMRQPAWGAALGKTSLMISADDGMVEAAAAEAAPAGAAGATGGTGEASEVIRPACWHRACSRLRERGARCLTRALASGATHSSLP